MKIARQAREDEEMRPRLPWLGLLVVSLVEQRLQLDLPFVTVCAARFARSRTNRANPLRGTGGAS